MQRSFLFNCFIVLGAGLTLGLSAPGIGIWITAWFCLAPLLFVVGLERSLIATFVYGFLFGLAYNCVYWQWLLNIAPLDWLGFNARDGLLMSWAALLIVSSHQALIIAIFALAYRTIFSSRLFSVAGWLGTWLHTLIVPLGWILIVNKLGNAHSLLGVPWSMLEYSQYKNLYLIQIADVIGGIGIAFLIVMVNTLLAKIAMRFVIEAWKKQSAGVRNKSGRSSSRLPAISSPVFNIISLIPAIAFSVAAIFLVQNYGQESLANLFPQPKESVSIVQPNINIEMCKIEKKYSVEDIVNLGLGLSQKCPPGLCVWTEGSVPLNLRENASVCQKLKTLAFSRHLSVIAGTFDKDKQNNFYNAAVAITSDPAASRVDSGRLAHDMCRAGSTLRFSNPHPYSTTAQAPALHLRAHKCSPYEPGHNASMHAQTINDFYHKRYLVPFGEYAPDFVDKLPYSNLIRTLTNTPAGTGYACGKKAAVLKIHDQLIAPLICFEVIAPELSTASVRAGGQLLVNINDLSWFHRSIIGEQMIACAVFRAIENRRYFVFAANTGPSAIITPMGQIQTQIGQGVPYVLTGKIDYLSELTPFTQWYVF